MIVLGLLAREGLRRMAARRRRGQLTPVPSLASAGLAGAVLAALLVAGPFAAFASTMNAPDALVTRNPAFVWATLVMHNMTDVETFVHPGKFYSPDFFAESGERLIVVVYLGLALLVPALAALATPARRQAEPWFLLFCCFFVLSLGPFLYVGGAYVAARGGWIPLPFLALYQWFPMFSRISHAYRFVVGPRWRCRCCWRSRCGSHRAGASGRACSPRSRAGCELPRPYSHRPRCGPSRWPM